MVEDALLIAGDEIVSDLRQKHRLSVTRQTPDDECRSDASGDYGDEIVALLIEDAVDDIVHDPCSKGRRPGDKHEARDGEDVVPDVLASVLAHHPANERDHLIRSGRRAGFFLRIQFPVRSQRFSTRFGTKARGVLTPRV